MKPLQAEDLSHTVNDVAETLNDRVRTLLRAEMIRKHLSQQDVADLLNWTQSRVAQKITGRTPITLAELESLCFAVGLSPVEAVRDPGLEFVADLKPPELRFLQRLRQFTPAQFQAALVILDVTANTQIVQRHAAPIRKRMKKIR